MNLIGRDEHEGIIAIVGMALRFPSAMSVDEFWRLLVTGQEGITYFEQQATQSGLTKSDKSPGASEGSFTYVPARGIVKDVEMFDASFFGFTPKEAAIADPQQRVFLECCWEALENAGQVPSKFDGMIGIFAGAGMNNYIANIYSDENLIRATDWYQIAIGNEKDHLALRAAYSMNLHGPAMSIQCACSSSLVAVHSACQSLLEYHCDMALAGGVALVIPQERGYVFTPGITSPDGHCRAFDQDANGLVSGNGCGVVVLMRLEDAVASGSTIYALIKGSAVNNDGASKIGYAAPSIEGQAAVIAMAQAAAGVAPETVGYVEAHGTATALGDAVEIAALTQVFRESTEKKQFCALGSVKTNIGHLDAAAGVAGLIKAALLLHHKRLVPSLNFRQANPHMDLVNGPFYVNTESKPWITRDHPRRAGVSAFGQGGTNAHVILEEAPYEERIPRKQKNELITLSARTSIALDLACHNLMKYIGDHPEADLGDVAYTLQTGRKDFKIRRAFIAKDLKDLQCVLSDCNSPRRLGGEVTLGSEDKVFLFPGIGDHYTNMGFRLYSECAAYREAFDHCAQILLAGFSLDIRKILFGPHATVHEPAFTEPAKEPKLDFRAMVRSFSDPVRPASALDQTRFVHPATFVIEYALAQLWLSLGVTPNQMIGYSIGEYVAACVAGIFPLETALRIVTRRAALINALPEGAMVAVAVPRNRLSLLIEEPLCLASELSPSACVVSGPISSIAAFESSLPSDVVWRRLNTRHAFHSSAMSAIAGEMFEELKGRTLSKPLIPIISGATGTWMTASEAQSIDYWVNQLSRPVEFFSALTTLLKNRAPVVIEVGPGQILSTLVAQHAMSSDNRCIAIPSMPRPMEAAQEYTVFLDAVAKVWLSGTDIAWEKMGGGEKRRRIPLPTYAFERTRYWIEGKRPLLSDKKLEVLPLAGDLESAFVLPSWRSTLVIDEGRGAAARTCLICTSNQSLVSEIIATLKRLRVLVVVVKVAQEFAHDGQLAFSINPACKYHYNRLLAELQQQNVVVDSIVHCWTFGDAPSEPGELCYRQLEMRGTSSILYLMQALVEHRSLSREDKAVNFVVVSDGLHAVNTTDRILPEKAAMLGFCACLPLEYPHIRMKSIDVRQEFDGGKRARQRLLEDLAEECLSCGPEPARLAYRGGTRWVETVEPLPPVLKRHAGSLLKTGGVYVMTGGLGKDSLARAKFLGSRYKARLALITRSWFPAREEWERFAAEGPHSPISQRIARLRELEVLGASVQVFIADVRDESAMKVAFDQIGQIFGRIDGVIHAAGITDARATKELSQLAKTDFDEHSHAKIYGVYVLERIVSKLDLDFVLLISSLASRVGGLGLSAYANACAFMDAFAQGRNAVSGSRWISVNWLGMSEGDTGEALEIILSHRQISRISVSPHLLKRNAVQRESSSSAAPVSDNGRPAKRPNLRNRFVAPEEENEIGIVEIFQELLGVTGVGATDSFLELGGDSLIAIQMLARVGKKFNVEIPLRILFNHPNARDLSTYLAHEHKISSVHSRKSEPCTSQCQLDGKSGVSTTTTRSIVNLRDGNGGTPMIFVHASGGTALCYTALLRHLDYPGSIYGIQAAEMTSNGPHEQVSMVNLARECALEVSAHFGDLTSCVLVGWSMGGMLAFELARQLTEIEIRVDLTVLIDAPAENHESAVPMPVNFVREIAWTTGCELQALNVDTPALAPDIPLEAQLEIVISLARQTNLIPEDLTLREFKGRFYEYARNVSSMRGYKPGTYDGATLLIRASFESLACVQGWQEVCTGKFWNHEISSTHHGILREPAVRSLAGTLVHYCRDISCRANSLDPKLLPL